MFSIRSTKTQVVALAVAGTIALSSVLGAGTALAYPNLAPNPSFESVNFSATGSEIVGWAKESKGTTNVQMGVTQGSSDTAVYVAMNYPVESKSANKGWSGFETNDNITIDPSKEYTFSASYYSPEKYAGIPWMDMTLFDAAGNKLGAVSTGSSKPVLNEWQEKTYTFKPEALQKYFPDIASVKLGLKLSMNSGITGIPKGQPVVLLYDNVTFEEIESDTP